MNMRDEVRGCGCALLFFWVGAMIVLAVMMLASCAAFRADPATPIGARPWLKVVNTSDRPCDVTVLADDGRHWEPGQVAAHDSVTWALPIMDENVHVMYCQKVVAFTVDGPYLWTIRTVLNSDIGKKP